MVLPRAERFGLFVARLSAGAANANREAAKRFIDDTLNAVEDEHSGVPYNPATWRTDGRFYPVQDDNAEALESHPDVFVYTSRKHETFIRENGAFEIREHKTGLVVVALPGADGRGVWS